MIYLLNRLRWLFPVIYCVRLWSAKGELPGWMFLGPKRLDRDSVRLYHLVTPWFSESVWAVALPPVRR